MKVLFTGGYTLGPVTPLLAVSEEVRKRDPLAEVFWIGTYSGPEKALIKEYNIPFKSICSGKFRRYWSIRHIADNFHFIIGFFQSFAYLIKNRPDVIVSAGGFVSVPVVFAGWFLRIPSLIHQQDVRPGLANMIMSYFASKITVAFEVSKKGFRHRNPIWIGNPVREDIFHNNRRESLDYFDFDSGRPVLLILGGGTGAQKINELVQGSIDNLLEFTNVIHVTGIGKVGKSHSRPGYCVFQFLTEGMVHAYDASDVVVSRAGMGTLTELAALEKPSIIIPIPDSHQELNAEAFASRDAVQYLHQKGLTPERFAEAIKYTFDNLDQYKERAKLMNKVLPRGARLKMTDMIFELATKRARREA